MTPKLENYGINLGEVWVYIEDHQDGRPDHFFPDLASHRYQLWSGGCGIGWADTLDEARYLLYVYAKDKLERDVAEAAEKLAVAQRMNTVLGHAVENLQVFRVPEDWNTHDARREADAKRV